MNDALIFTIIGTLAGALGTGFGGLLSFFIKNSKRLLSSILEFSCGLMIAVCMFDLIPHSIEYSSLRLCILGMIIGVLFMIFCENITTNLFFSQNSMIKTGIVLAVGIALHNFPEGLAIGSSFDTNIPLGITLAISIFVHDIPEGIAMALPLKFGGIKTVKIFIITVLTGCFTGFGALIGSFIGHISHEAIAFCLSVSSGAMIYICFFSLIPKSKSIYKGNMSSFFNIIGIIFGIFLSNSIR